VQPPRGRLAVSPRSRAVQTFIRAVPPPACRHAALLQSGKCVFSALCSNFASKAAAFSASFGGALSPDTAMTAASVPLKAPAVRQWRHADVRCRGAAVPPCCRDLRQRVTRSHNLN
jgi:hypothetical protein